MIIKPILISFFILNFGISLIGQKFGYVDTKYILNQLSEYNEAKAEIDKLAQAWTQEIIEMEKDVEKLEAKYKAEEVLLTVDMRQDRQLEIERRRNEIKAYQQQIFGSEGQYFLKKKELIKPSQDRVYVAVDRVSKNNRIQIMFDKAGDLVMIYTDPIHDYTDFVLEELNLNDNNN